MMPLGSRSGKRQSGGGAGAVVTSDPRSPEGKRVRFSFLPYLSERQQLQLDTFRDALFEHNQTTNLTAIRDLDGIERRLIRESVRLVRPLESVLPPETGRCPRVLDIGTGGGLPGLVLAIALPDIEFTLLDATGKKIAFVQHVIDQIGLTNARTIHDRAETIARDPALRETVDIAVARAVTSLPALIELGLPLVRLGGHLLLPKGTAIDDELREGKIAAATVGGRILHAAKLPEAGSGIETRLVMVKKTAPTSEAYPRRAGLPSRSPLGRDSGNGPTGLP